MAQVTMTSQEYLEMVDAVRRLEQIEKDMLDNVEVELNLESSYNKCSIEIVPTFTAKIQKQIVSKIVGVITAEPIVMDHLFEDIEVKENAIELLERTLRAKRRPCMIGTGAMSDPYIPLELELGSTSTS